jgi:hypothetical protein
MVKGQDLNEPSHSQKHLPDFKPKIWVLGGMTWVMGIFDRGADIVLGKNVSVISIFQLMIVTILFVGWLFLKPAKLIGIKNP